MSTATLRIGDWVVYCKTKFSPRPGSRARNIQPASHGDEYCYTVDKFWYVAAIGTDGSLTLRTRRGKQHRVAADDPHLRRPSLWERWWYRDRFTVSTPPSDSSGAAGRSAAMA